MPGGGNWVGVKGELSLASPNPLWGFGLARDSLGRFFWRVGDEGWGCERDGRMAPGTLGGRTWRGVGVEASRAEAAGLRPAATQGEEKAGTPGGGSGEESEEAGEHGGSEGGTWDRGCL